MSEQNQSSEVQKPFEGFELAVAVLLGLAALGTAWVGYQSGLWGGKMSEAYSEAAKMTAEAGAVNNDMLVEMAHDQSVDVEAKKLIAEGRDTEDETDRSRDFELASYLYLYQLSDDAYKSLELPADIKEKSLKEPQGDQEEELMIPEKALQDAFYVDLDEAYYDKKFKEVNQMFEEADDKFEEGRKANEIGDQFDLAGVIFTASLFFGGLSLVFKTRMRWGFLLLGTGIFLVAVIFTFTLPMA